MHNMQLLHILPAIRIFCKVIFFVISGAQNYVSVLIKSTQGVICLKCKTSARACMHHITGHIIQNNIKRRNGPLILFEQTNGANST